MIDKRLINIKNLLKIIISCFVIVTMFKSCAKAYTWDEFKEYLNDYTNNTNLSQDTKNTCSWLISQFNWIQSHMYQGHTPNDYSNFCFYTQYSGGKYWVYLIMFNNNYNNISYNSGYFNKPNGNQAYLFYGLRGGTGFSTSEEANNNRTVNNGGYGSGGLTDIVPNSNLNSNTYFSYLYPTTPPFSFTFIDESISATTPVGDTAYCVFLDPLQSFQKIGYINDFENHLNTSITIFAQNYRTSSNVLVNTLGEDMYYLDDNGYLFVNTNTMWSPMVYEIVGIDGQDNFVTHYYIAAGGNVNGEPMFYSGDISYDDNQFFLWKLLGSFGSGSGDSGDTGFGILGGLYNLFVPSEKNISDFIDDRKVFIENNSGFFLKPSVAFVSILNKMYESGDFVIEIPTISIPR